MTEKRDYEFVPFGAESPVDPLEDATRVIGAIRRRAKAAARLLEVPCSVEGCQDFAKFRTDEPAFVCVDHAREVHERGGKLWSYDQPEVVYLLREIGVIRTRAERDERFREATDPERVRRAYTMEQVEKACGMDLPREGHLVGTIHHGDYGVKEGPKKGAPES